MSSISEDEISEIHAASSAMGREPSEFSTDLSHHQQSPLYRAGNDSVTSSRASSPFHAQNEVSADFEAASSTAAHDIPHSITQNSFSRHDLTTQTDEMEKSITSLKNSLADMRVNTKSLNSLRSRQDDPTEEDTIDTSKFDETQAQFHHDIDLGTNSQESSSTRPPSATQRSAFRSPWRQMRSSTYSPAPPHLTIPPVAPLRFGMGEDTKVGSAASNSSSSTGTINELNRQLTGYKMQIRFFKQFLQKLIEEDNGLDIKELTQLRDGLSPVKKISSHSSSGTVRGSDISKQKVTESEQYMKLESDYRSLSSSYDEIFKLNEDLYTSLEQFQERLEEKDKGINDLKKTADACVPIIDGIIQILLGDPQLDLSSQGTLSKCLDRDVALDVKLRAVRTEMGKKYNNVGKSVELERASTRSSGSITVVDREKQFEINNYIKTIHQLMSTLEQLRNEFDDQNQLVDKMKKELDFEIEQSEQLRANNTMMKESLDNITEIIDQTVNMSNSREMDHLKHENQRLSVLNATMNKKFEEYQQVIDHLQTEVRSIKDANTSQSYTGAHNISELNEELLQSHRDFNKLQEDFNDLHSQYSKLKEDSSNTISSLTNQLHHKKQEVSSLRADKVVMEKAQQELDIAVERQRTLKAEKIRLTYKVESLTKDKISLQTTIQNLTDKVTDLTVSDSQNSRTVEEDSTNVMKRVHLLEYQIAEILQLDTSKFQKLLKSFNKIADDVSLKEPTRKVEYMSNVFEANSQNLDDSHSNIGMDFSNISTIKEYHKSVFDYFTRAVDVIVNDHVKLLLKESEEASRSSEYVNKLHQRIDELNRINDEISRSFDSTSHGVVNSRGSSMTDLGEVATSSPRARLRIEELTSRWKAEREARVYENNEAEARLNELEAENSRLREQLRLSE